MAMNIRRMQLADLNPADYNPRKDLQPDDPAYLKIKQSLETFGMVEPIIWNERTGHIVGGHQRIKALRDMGEAETDVVVINEPLKEEKKLNVILNRAKGRWDNEKLAPLMQELSERGDVSITGFEDYELQGLIDQYQNRLADILDYSPPKPQPDNEQEEETPADATYTANIETLKGTSYQDLGITEDNYKALMSYVQDGSEQAAGLAASMVSAINSGNKDAVSKLANTLADVTAKQDAAAQATADWVTDYEGQLDEFQSKMEQTVDDLDLSDEAGKAAKDTIAEYVQKLKDGKKDAVAAAKDVAASVALALQNSTTYTPPTTTPTVPGHAGGTTDAEDIFVAGENGPELIVGKQGSTVFPTEETDRIIDALNGIDDAPAKATAAPASETTYNTVTDDHTTNTDRHDVTNQYTTTDSHDVTNDIANDYSVTDSHDLTDASVLNDSHDVTNTTESYTTDNSVENHITQEQADKEKQFDRFLQAVTGITIDAPEPAPGESLFASVLGKAADIISGKNSDLPKIEAAYMGLSATPQAATESYDLTELEKILAEQQPTAPALTDEQQGTATAAPASEAAPTLEPAPLNVQPIDAAAAPQNVQNAPAETVKRIILELVGKGTIEVSGGSGSGLTENEVLELLTDNMKPVLMGIIKQEIFEEGQLSYEY